MSSLQLVFNSRFNLLFGLLCGVYLTSLLFPVLELNWLLKILPILSLLALTFGHFADAQIRLFGIGLIFSMAGDVFLALSRDDYFVFGLGAFLVAHLFYIASLVPFTIRNKMGAFTYIVYGLLIINLLFSHLGDLWLPVVFYMLVLLFMGIATLLSKRSNAWLITGGISFVLSDSIIGLNKFYVDIAFAPLLIMTTYYLAQYCLTRGLIKATANRID